MPKRRKKTSCNWVLILGALLLIFIWDPFWKADLNKAPMEFSAHSVLFTIEEGWGAQTIASQLEEQELIISSKSFLRAIKDQGVDRKLSYGSFSLWTSMTMQEVIDVLAGEGSGDITVTLLEGWTIEEIDTQLSELGLIQAGSFIDCSLNCELNHPLAYDLEGMRRESLEGILFPDTYFVNSASFSSAGFIEQLLSTFDSRFSAIIGEESLSKEVIQELEIQSGRGFEEIINVASMIEKEVRTEGDLELVSGIIWKRLDSGWTLGIDATLLYVQDDNILTASDLAEDTPYNTRIFKGLPPTPIANPGSESLKAAVFPEDSEYWFYLTTLDTGEVIYAVTNAEHEANKYEYL